MPCASVSAVETLFLQKTSSDNGMGMARTRKPPRSGTAAEAIDHAEGTTALASQCGRRDVPDKIDRATMSGTSFATVVGVAHTHSWAALLPSAAVPDLRDALTNGAAQTYATSRTS